MMDRGKIYGIVQAITPPFIFLALKKSRSYSSIRAFAEKHMKSSPAAEWVTISAGPLKGRHIYIDASSAWRDMATGDYDAFFLDYLNRLDLRGKVVYDIGAHFGYSSMCFAQIVGPTGNVHAFEPSRFNIERFDLHMSRNKELAGIIKLHPVAVSDKSGEADFVYSYDVDHGASSGSFIIDADTFYEKDSYEKIRGFRKTKVKTVPVDSFASIGIADKPQLIKIDVEGAEFLVLEGALETLAKHRPVLLIEIHSIFNMLKVGGILRQLNYEIELLKEEADGRCFIAAR